MFSGKETKREEIMKRIAMLLFGAVLWFGFVPLAQAATGEGFPKNSGQWEMVTTNDLGVLASSPARWELAGGNPGGHLSAPMEKGKMRLYALQAPSGSETLFGDLTGKTLSVDCKVVGNVDGSSRGVRVHFFIGYTGGGQERYWVTRDEKSWAPGADKEWTTHQVELVERNFRVWPNADKGKMSFQEVLKRYNDIGIVFGEDFLSSEKLGVRGFGNFHVDSFGAVAAPGKKVPATATAIAKRPSQKARPKQRQPRTLTPAPPGGLMPVPGMPGGLFQMLPMFGSAMIVMTLGMSGFFYLLFAFFLYLIAKKTRVAAAWTAWVPFVNAYTMVAAAGKPLWWLVLLALPLISFIPIVGLIGLVGAVVSFVMYILIWMAISERFNVSKWAGLLMLVPVVQWIYMGYLALRRESTPVGVSIPRVALIALVVFVLVLVAIWALLTFVLAPGFAPPPTTL
jgi:hypothetical protein